MKASINVLLIDDDEDEYILCRDLLGEVEQTNYSLNWVDNYQDGLKAIKNNQYDAYLIDYILGKDVGLDLIEKARKNTSAPLILLTGLGNFEIDEQAKKSGADDYIVKSEVQGSLLDRTIRYSIERQRNLNEITKLNQNLEHRVQQRTIQLDKVIEELERKNKNLQAAEKKIRKALEREKELNELKTRFVSMASHEFRTPLATILSSVTLIGKYTKTEDQPSRDKHIKRIANNVEHLTNTLNDFLSLGRLEEGVISYVPHFFDFQDFLTRLIEDMTVNCKTGQYFINETVGTPREVKFDDKILKNILINLLSNAIKYSPPASEIRIKSSFLPHAFEVEVSDEGIGIDENEKKHVFDRFFRAENAANIAGTGLGLNIVVKYLEMMNGEISFDSEVNKGSTFKISLPPNYKSTYEKDTADRG